MTAATVEDFRREMWAAEGDVPDDVSPGAPVIVIASTVKPEAVSWLWPGVLPIGKLVTLDGDPGLGKSTITLDLAARISAGHAMPDGSRPEAAGVVLLTGEDGLADTIRPRLEAAGADLARVAAMTAARDAEGRPAPPVFPDDVEAARIAVRKMGARLLIVDPIMAFLGGGVDGHKDQDVRSVLRLLAELAETEHCCIIVVRHLRKTAAGNALYRGSGSIAFIGAARVGLIVAADPQDETRRILAQAKNNLAPLAPTLAYRIAPAVTTSRIEWLGVSSVTAADAMAAAEGPAEDRSGRQGAEEFLREILADGPMPSKEVFVEAKAAGIAEKTLRRAQAALGVRAHKMGGRFGGDPAWYWELSPPSRRSSPEDGQSPLKVATVECGHLQASWPPSGAPPLPENPAEAVPTGCYRRGGVDYRAGDTLPDGRIVESIEDGGVPILRRPLTLAPEVAQA